MYSLIRYVIPGFLIACIGCLLPIEMNNISFFTVIGLATALNIIGLIEGRTFPCGRKNED